MSELKATLGISSSPEQTEIIELTLKLNKACKAYAEGKDTGLNDNEYDVLFRKLRSLEERYPEYALPLSPTKTVGAHPTGSIKHLHPMLSLANVFTDVELLGWIDKVKKLTSGAFIIENKMDGLAISITYKYGVFTSAATRGDGTKGEVCTAQVAGCVGVPGQIELLKLVPVVEIHGELIMPNDALVLINNVRLHAGMPPYSNPRNAAAGCLRSKDPSVAANARLTFIPYGGSEELFDGLGVKTYTEAMALISTFMPKALCLNTKIYTGEEILHDDNRYMKSTYGTDGLVIKVDTLADRKVIGVNSHEPKWAVAYKFQAFMGISVLRRVTWQVGRTGRLTPVANIDPVEISGSTIRRVTLHNLSEIKRLGIRIGSEVTVAKQADVIPKIIDATNKGDTSEIIVPDECPSCNTKVYLNYKDTNPTYVCENDSCVARLTQNILYLVSRKVLDIDGIGDRAASRLVLGGYIKKHPLELFLLDKAALEYALESDVLANKVLFEILNHREMSGDKFINALCIPYIGKTASKLLAPCYESIADLYTKTICFDTIKGLGPVAALTWDTSIHPMLALISDVIPKLTVVFDSNKAPEGPLSGMRFVITGSFTGITRDEISDKIIQNGGTVMSAVSRSTDFLLHGENAGSKLSKAVKLGIKCINLNDLDKMSKG